MKLKLCFVIGLGLLAGCSEPPSMGPYEIPERPPLSRRSSRADGKALFSANCATCHHPLHRSTGPVLRGVSVRWESDSQLFNYVRSPKKSRRQGVARAKWLAEQYADSMPGFPDLSDDQIAAILNYTGY